MKNGQKVANFSKVAKLIFWWPNSLKSGQISKFWPQSGRSGNPDMTSSNLLLWMPLSLGYLLLTNLPIFNPYAIMSASVPAAQLMVCSGHTGTQSVICVL